MIHITDIIYDTHYIHKLRQDLSEKRLEHTIRVATMAFELAKHHRIDTEKAAIAGLLHDCAKNMSDKKKLKLCQQYKIQLTSNEVENPDLIHAKVGAYLAYHHYHVKDQAILDAIAFHTTGRPNMSDLEKIVFIADYIEPGRKHHGRLEMLREKAMMNINETVIGIIEDTIEHLKERSKRIDPITIEAYKYYKELNIVGGII